MGPPPLQLTAFTRRDRGDATWRVKEAFSESGALLLDARLFSNMATCFIFEVPGERVADLHVSLAGAGITLSDDSEAELARAEREAASGRDKPGSLMLTFVHGEPDLAIDVPAVPG